MAYNPKDYYFKKAKEQKYAARSVFKLEEIQNRFRIFRQGDQVLDLGAAPGSWSQYASKVIGPKGKILGIDLSPIHITLPNALFLQGDIHEIDLLAEATLAEIKIPFDVVMSDMAPKTTGIRITDQARSSELCEFAFHVSQQTLKPGGHFICKLFHSEDFVPFRELLKKNFQTVEVLRPKSTRKESKEIFFIAKGFKQKA